MAGGDYTGFFLVSMGVRWACCDTQTSLQGLLKNLDPIPIRKSIICWTCAQKTFPCAALLLLPSAGVIQRARRGSPTLTTPNDLP